MCRIRSRRSVAAITLHALICLCAAAGACHETPPGMRYLPNEGEDLPILRQLSGTHSHEARAMQIVIRDDASLAKLPLTKVDVNFDREMLLIVVMGRVPSDQYAVKIDRVWREGRRLLVKTIVQTPPAGAPLTVASPWCIAVVPRCDLNVQGFATEPPKRVRTWGQSEPGI